MGDDQDDELHYRLCRQERDNPNQAKSTHHAARALRPYFEASPGRLNPLQHLTRLTLYSPAGINQYAVGAGDWFSFATGADRHDQCSDAVPPAHAAGGVREAGARQKGRCHCGGFPGKRTHIAPRALGLQR